MVSKLLALAGGMRGFLVLIGAGLVGVTVGIMGFTFGYANGFAYFADDPATCKQCHSMNKQYDAWAKGSHKTVACQECHSPEKHSQPVDVYKRQHRLDCPTRRDGHLAGHHRR